MNIDSESVPCAQSRKREPCLATLGSKTWSRITAAISRLQTQVSLRCSTCGSSVLLMLLCIGSVTDDYKLIVIY